MNYLKDLFKKIFIDMYGSEENQDKSILGVALGFLFFAGVFLVIFILCYDRHNLLTASLSVYMILLFFEIPIMMFSAYIFQSKKNREKRKLLKYSFFILSIVFLVILFLPVTLFFLFIDKVKFYNVFRYAMLYFISFAASLLIDSIAGTIMYILLCRYGFLNYLTISVMGVFILNFILMKLMGYSYFKYKVWRCEKRARKDKAKSEINRNLAKNYTKDSEQFQKELYVLNFVVIAFGTAGIYFVNLDKVFLGLPLKSLRESVLYSFALYTAFDRLKDKWKKAFTPMDEVGNQKEIKTAELISSYKETTVCSENSNISRISTNSEKSHKRKKGKKYKS